MLGKEGQAIDLLNGDSRQGKPGISKLNQEADTTADKTAERRTEKAVIPSTSDITTDSKVEVKLLTAVQVPGRHGKIIRGSTTTGWKSAETDMLLAPCLSVKNQEVTATESVVHTDQLERVSILVENHALYPVTLEAGTTLGLLQPVKILTADELTTGAMSSCGNYRES